MSFAVLDSTPASTQLRFLWDEPELVATNTSSCTASREAAEHSSSSNNAKGHHGTNIRQLAPKRPECINRSTRIGKEVRLGSVMIRLLKSYGITDDEILEGVASYARKQQLSRAS